MTDERVTAATLRERREELGVTLAFYRRAAGLTQFDLAARALCSRSSVANIEVGRQKGQPEFWRIADKHLKADGVLLKGSVHLAELARTFSMQEARERAAEGLAPKCDPERCACAVVVVWWTGRETRALRLALRLAFPEFAGLVNVPTATAAGWEQPPPVEPGLTAQIALNRALARAKPDVRARFRLALTHKGLVPG
jgi:DNA-binding transcriptional regulator YiaG